MAFSTPNGYAQALYDSWRKPSMVIAVTGVGMALGIVAILLAFVPVVSRIALYTAILSFVCSMSGLILSIRRNRYGFRLSVIGVVLSAISAILALYIGLSMKARESVETTTTPKVTQTEPVSPAKTSDNEILEHDPNARPIPTNTDENDTQSSSSSSSSNSGNNNTNSTQQTQTQNGTASNIAQPITQPSIDSTEPIVYNTQPISTSSGTGLTRTEIQYVPVAVSTEDIERPVSQTDTGISMSATRVYDQQVEDAGNTRIRVTYGNDSDTPIEVSASDWSKSDGTTATPAEDSKGLERTIVNPGTSVEGDIIISGDVDPDEVKVTVPKEVKETTVPVTDEKREDPRNSDGAVSQLIFSEPAEQSVTERKVTIPAGACDRGDGVYVGAISAKTGVDFAERDCVIVTVIYANTDRQSANYSLKDWTIVDSNNKVYDAIQIKSTSKNGYGSIAGNSVVEAQVFFPSVSGKFTVNYRNFYIDSDTLASWTV